MKEVIAVVVLGLVGISLLQFALGMRGAGKRNLKRIDEILADDRLMSWTIVSSIDLINVEKLLRRARSSISSGVKLDLFAAAATLLTTGAAVCVIGMRTEMEPDGWMLLVTACRILLGLTVASCVLLSFLRSAIDFTVWRALRNLSMGKGASRMGDLEDGRTPIARNVGVLGNELRYNAVVHAVMGFMLLFVIWQYWFAIV